MSFLNETYKAEYENSTISVLHSGYQISGPRHSFGPAVHDGHVLHLIVSGKGRYCCMGKDYALEAGDGFYIPPGVSVYYEADQDRPWEYYWVGFDGLDAAAFVARLGLGKGCPTFSAKGERQRIAQTFHELFYTSKTYPDQKLAMTGYLYLLFSLLAQPECERGIPYQEQYVRSAKEYIDTHLMLPFSVKDVAEQVGIDRTYLYRIFRAGTGLPPSEYIARARLARACAYLRETSLPIHVISNSLGFDSPSHFSKFVKKRVGLQPMAYRAKSGRNKV